MKNPFEAPKQEAPKEEASVDIDVSDFGTGFGEGIRDFEPGEIEAKHAALHEKLAPEREAGEAKENKREGDLAAIAEGFFANNPFLKKRFEKEPDAMRRFKEGLAALIDNRAHGYQTEPSALIEDPRFQKDLIKYSFDFEEEEAKRSAGRRAA